MHIRSPEAAQARTAEYRHHVSPAPSKYHNQWKKIIRKQETVCHQPQSHCMHCIYCMPTHPSQDHHPIIGSPVSQYTKPTDQSRNHKEGSQHKCNGRNYKHRSPTRGHRLFVVAHRSGSRCGRSREEVNWRLGHGCRRVQVQVQAIEIYRFVSSALSPGTITH